jgi:hypothetical protein
MYDMNTLIKNIEQNDLIKKLNKSKVEDVENSLQSKLIIMENENLKNEILMLKQK